uniref:Uncharacterized protein n=1 Tax=Cacopsylla melanoneura TaxID=428564 RepID=A0A8D8R2B1_9HEMI
MYTLYLSPHFMSRENSMLPVLYSGGCGSIPVTRYRDKGVLVETRSPCPSSYPCLVMTPCTDLRLHSLILTRRNPSPNQWRFVLWIWRRSIFSLRRVQDKRPPSLRRVQDKRPPLVLERRPVCNRGFNSGHAIVSDRNIAIPLYPYVERYILRQILSLS